MFQIILLDTDSIIFYGYIDLVTCIPCTDIQMKSNIVPLIFYRIIHQIEDYISEMHLVHIDGSIFCLQIRRNLTAVLSNLQIEGFDDAFQQHISIQDFLFESNPILSITFACMVLVIGLVFILSMAMLGNPYRKLKSERLLFDPMYYSELSSAREAQKKKSLVFIIIAICLILVAGISGMFAMPTFPISEIQCILVACSVYLFIYVIGISDNYDILVNSEERMETIYWRIVKKIKNKKD